MPKNKPRSKAPKAPKATSVKKKANAKTLRAPSNKIAPGKTKLSTASEGVDPSEIWP